MANTTLSSLIGSGGIKRIQQGTITVSSVSGDAASSNTATITSVNTAKAVCLPLGFTMNSVGNGSARVSLTNATTVTANVENNDSNTQTFTVGYVVVEFN